MKVLVTGATGFVGHAVVSALRQRDHSVIGLVRDRTKAYALEKEDVTLAVGDMFKPETYQDIVADIDVVIQAAQATPVGRLSHKAMLHIQHGDAVMTTTLATACVVHDKVFIYSSGCFIYGNHGDEWITEETPATPSPLGQGHYAMVQMLEQMRQEKSLKYITLTPGFVYGPGGLFKTSFYDTLNKGQLRVFGNGRNYWSSIHCADLAAAYALAVESSAYGETYNIMDDTPLRLRDMVDQLTTAMGKPKVGTIPPWLLKLIIGGPLVDSLVTSFRIGNAKAKRDLGWTPRYPSFQDGLPDVLARMPTGD